MVHTYYQLRGGEDISFEVECELLARAGVDVVPYTRSNDEIGDLGPLRTVTAPLWNGRARRDLQEHVDRVRPDVVAINNDFPLLSPAVLRVSGAPVVKSLRNYRLSCPNGMLYRDAGVCHDCVGKPLAWPGVVHGCYRGSRTQSAGTAAMLLTHRAARTWHEHVDRYLVLTEFMRGQLAGVVPPEKTVIRPNTLTPEPEPGDGRAGYVLFVGRLAWEKGPMLLLEAWRALGDSAPPLRLIGDGPQEPEVIAAAAHLPTVTLSGALPHEHVLEAMREAALVVVPSVVYEGFPRAIVEALACGTPVVAPAHGASLELVDDTIGATYAPGDAASLARVVTEQLPLAAGKRAAARARFEERYDNDAFVRVTLEAYRQADAAWRERRRAGGARPLRSES